MYNKVFISYATEDYQYAEKLYNFLGENSFVPWMDKKNLLPGQSWDLMIQQALRNADFILLLLSSTSVNKRGYVQREFKQAVIYCEEKLDSDIYIIPLKIDACEPPEKLKKFQWVEYSAEDAFEKILTSLNLQRSQIIKEEEIKKHRLLGFEYEEKVIAGQYGEKEPKQLYDINYPQFKDESNRSLKEVNIIIQNITVQYLLGVRHNFYTYLNDSFSEEHWNNSDSTENVSIHFQLLHPYFISFTDFVSTYNTGAAHGNYGTSGHNYLINPLRKIYLEDLFENFELIIPKLRDAVHNKLMEWAKNHYEGDISDGFYIFDEGLEPKKENFDNYYFTENALVFIYNPYHLTAWCYGDQQPEITFEELFVLFPNEKKLHQFIDLIQAK